MGNGQKIKRYAIPFFGKLYTVCMLVALPCTVLASSEPYLESVEGDRAVTVIHQAVPRIALEGDMLAWGDKITTTESGACRIVFVDGSRITLAGSTEYALENEENGVPSSVLDNGTAHAVVEKANATGVHKFFMKSNGVIMGVRGTEFVVEASKSQETATIHTFDGVVEAASDRQNLIQGHGTKLQREQYISNAM